VTETDLLRMSAHLGLGPEDVRVRFLNRDPDGFSLKCRNPVLTDAECVFLGEEEATAGSGRKRPACTLYEARPEACRTWPFWERLASDQVHYDQSRRTCGMLRDADHAAFKAEFLRRRR